MRIKAIKTKITLLGGFKMQLRLSIAMLGAAALFMGYQTSISRQTITGDSKNLAPVTLTVSGMT
jgi:hypothetical protein